MSSDSEKRSFIVPQYPPQPAVFYLPTQGIPMQTIATSGDEALARALQAEENSVAPVQQIQEERPCRFSSFFRRRCGGYQKLGGSSGCCMKDDGRPLGNLTSFTFGVLSGTVLPFLSLMFVYGFESNRLARTGALYGHANFFILLAIFSLRHIGLLALLPFLIGLLFLVISRKSFTRFMFAYNTRQNKTADEEVVTVSQIGTPCKFVLAFLAALLLPIVGAPIALIAGRKLLRSRCGAIAGLSVQLMVFGIIHIVHGLPPALFLFGLILVEISSVHFRRAIASAEQKEGAVSNC